MTKGSSLIEMIFYLAALGLIFVVFTNIFISIGKTYGTLLAVRLLDNSAMTSMDSLTREIKAANKIDPVSVLDVSPGELMLDDVDPSGNVLVADFLVENDILHMKKAGADLGSLLTGNVTVKNLVFRKIVSNFSTAIKVEMSLEYKKGDLVRDQKYYSTIVLRSSYQNE